MTFICGVIVGLFVGATIGLVVMALMTAASDREEQE